MRHIETYQRCVVIILKFYIIFHLTVIKPYFCPHWYHNKVEKYLMRALQTFSSPILLAFQVKFQIPQKTFWELYRNILICVSPGSCQITFNLWSKICFLSFGVGKIFCKNKRLLILLLKPCIWYTVFTFFRQCFIHQTTFAKYAKEYRSFECILTQISYA